MNLSDLLRPTWTVQRQRTYRHPLRNGRDVEGYKMVSADEWQWLLEHDAVVHLSAGKKVGVDFRRRRDGLRIQVSAWEIGEAIAEAKRLEATP